MLLPLHARPITWLICARANAAALCCLRCRSCVSLLVYNSRTLFVIVGGWQLVRPAWQVALVHCVLYVALGELSNDVAAPRQQPQQLGKWLMPEAGHSRARSLRCCSRPFCQQILPAKSWQDCVQTAPLLAHPVVSEHPQV
jgi:hypothetical protein